MTLKEAVGKVLEGWTLPNAVRKILEEAYFAEPQSKEPEQEPVAWMLEQGPHIEFERRDYHNGVEWTPLYTTPPYVATPPQRSSRSDMTWVGLTDDEISVIAFNSGDEESAIHAAMDLLKEKNT